jgi:hypothetical protein
MQSCAAQIPQRSASTRACQRSRSPAAGPVLQRASPMTPASSKLASNWLATRSLSRDALHGSCSSLPRSPLSPQASPHGRGRSVGSGTRVRCGRAVLPECHPARQMKDTTGQARRSCAQSSSSSDSDTAFAEEATSLWHGRALERALAQVEQTLEHSSRCPLHGTVRSRQAPARGRCRCSTSNAEHVPQGGCESLSDSMHKHTQDVRSHSTANHQTAHIANAVHDVHWADEPGVYRLQDAARALDERRQQAAQRQQARQHRLQCHSKNKTAGYAQTSSISCSGNAARSSCLPIVNLRMQRICNLKFWQAQGLFAGMLCTTHIMPAMNLLPQARPMCSHGCSQCSPACAHCLSAGQCQWRTRRRACCACARRSTSVWQKGRRNCDACSHNICSCSWSFGAA